MKRNIFEQEPQQGIPSSNLPPVVVKSVGCKKIKRADGQEMIVGSDVKIGKLVEKIHMIPKSKSQGGGWSEEAFKSYDPKSLPESFDYLFKEGTPAILVHNNKQYVTTVRRPKSSLNNPEGFIFNCYYYRADGTCYEAPPHCLKKKTSELKFLGDGGKDRGLFGTPTAIGF